MLPVIVADFAKKNVGPGKRRISLHINLCLSFHTTLVGLFQAASDRAHPVEMITSILNELYVVQEDEEWGQE